MHVARFPAPLLFLLAATQAQAQSLAHFMRDVYAPHKDTLRGSIIADGSVKNALDSNSGAAGAGSLGLRLATTRWVVQGSITVNDNPSLLTQDYDMTVVHPTFSNDGPSAILEAARPNLFNVGSVRNIGITGYAFLSQAHWAARNPSSVVADDAIASVIGLGGLFFVDLNGQSTTNVIGISIGFGPSLRWVGGEADRAFRADVLRGNGNAFAIGGEGFLALTANRVTIFVQPYALHSDGKSDIDGFHAVFGVALRGDLYRLDYGRT